MVTKKSGDKGIDIIAEKEDYDSAIKGKKMTNVSTG